ncbi:transposase [Sagittula sp. MA-2]|uniref:transposase n=1 Tax=Sagittula sp. MA-2 TaxID=3048007 RepID=UPI00358FE248
MPCRAVDSTGIKAEGKGEWQARKHGGAKRRLWRKIHIGVDEQTLEIRAIEITGSNIGDAPMLPELLDQIPADVELGTVTADGAYDTRKCHDAVADRGAHAPSYRRESPRPQAPLPETRRCAHRDTSAAPSGESGADTTAEAAPRRRCIT